MVILGPSKPILPYIRRTERQTDAPLILRKCLLIQCVYNNILIRIMIFKIMNEPSHEKMCLMSYANNKGTDQPVHPRSLISAFVVRCLDSVMSLVSVTKISSLMLVSVAEQASLSLTWSKTSEDTFSQYKAQIISFSSFLDIYE